MGFSRILTLGVIMEIELNLVKVAGIKIAYSTTKLSNYTPWLAHSLSHNPDNSSKLQLFLNSLEDYDKYAITVF